MSTANGCNTQYLSRDRNLYLDRTGAVVDRTGTLVMDFEWDKRMEVNAVLTSLKKNYERPCHEPELYNSRCRCLGLLHEMPATHKPICVIIKTQINNLCALTRNKDFEGSSPWCYKRRPALSSRCRRSRMRSAVGLQLPGFYQTVAKILEMRGHDVWCNKHLDAAIRTSLALEDTYEISPELRDFLRLSAPRP
jgi:hypothetical protein